MSETASLSDFGEGDRVVMVGGPFDGLGAVITRTTHYRYENYSYFEVCINKGIWQGFTIGGAGQPGRMYRISDPPFRRLNALEQMAEIE